MTSSFATRLARRIDEIADGTETVLLETDLDVVLTGLSAASAAELAMLCLELEWAINVEDGSDSECSLDQLGEDLEPYRLVIHKPASDELRYLTNAGFQNWLSNATSVGCISVCQLTSPF